MTLNAGRDIVIGLVLMYLTLSLACTVLNEMIASLLRLRAVTLAAGTSRSVRMRHRPEPITPTRGTSWI